MPEVILDGPGAGMTTQEYEAKRKVDCAIAEYFGWRRAWTGDASDDALLPPYQSWTSPAGFDVYRDGRHDREGADEGIPHFSFDMNGAWLVFGEVVRKWSYLARQKFWDFLQQRAALDPVAFTRPQFPDCFETLMPEMHEHICAAFLETVKYHGEYKLSLESQSPRAAKFSESIEKEEFEETLEDGRTVKRQKITSTKAPWVH